MQAAKTSKFMLPCRRRVHLHTSASFKTIFEQIQTNHKNYIKFDPKMIEKSVKITSTKCYKKQRKQNQIGGPILELVA